MKNLLKNKTRAIIFDFDGMLFEEDELFSSRLHREFGIPIEEMIPFFVEDLQRCQRGDLDMQQVLKAYLPIWGLEKMTFDSFVELWFNHGNINKKLLEYAKKIKKQGFLFALITNNEKYRVEYIVEKYDLGGIIDIIVKPYELGSIKPAREVYESAIEKIGLHPQNIIFFDDNKESVEMASKVGLESHLYRGLEDFKKKIANFTRG